MPDKEPDSLPVARGTKTSRGDALVVWGEYADDALWLRTEADLAIALDGLHAMGVVQPCMMRLWSPRDDQVVAVLSGFECAIYVIESQHGYGRTVGDPTRP